ncbi:MAG TPA: hypothetical protein VFP20_07700 [Bacteroidales bacterium]|nr:hypothetical protein [Bacteroidales bacterium]
MPDIKAQDAENEAKIPIQMAIPPSTKLNLRSTQLSFSLYKMENGKKVLEPSTIDSVWLNYSSITERNKSNTIYADITSADIPAEIGIKLVVRKDAGKGNGQVGNPTEPIILSEYPQPVITNIGSCYTGQGDHKGHLLLFSWVFMPGYNKDFSNFENLSNLSVQVIYTINSDE